MFLIRMGNNAKAVITGDITQIDLPNPRKSGLIEAIDCAEICRWHRLLLFRAGRCGATSTGAAYCLRLRRLHAGQRELPLENARNLCEMEPTTNRRSKRVIWK